MSLLCAVTPPTHAETHDVAPSTVREARREVEFRLGVGTALESLIYVGGQTEVPSRMHLDHSRGVFHERTQCRFEFLPNGEGALPVQIAVSRVDGGPWVADFPECNLYPENCEARVRRADAIDLAIETGLEEPAEGGRVSLAFYPPGDPRLCWLVSGVRTGPKGRASERRLVIDALTGEWYEERGSRPCLR